MPLTTFHTGERNPNKHNNKYAAVAFVLSLAAVALVVLVSEGTPATHEVIMESSPTDATVPDTASSVVGDDGGHSMKLANFDKLISAYSTSHPKPKRQKHHKVHKAAAEPSKEETALAGWSPEELRMAKRVDYALDAKEVNRLADTGSAMQSADTETVLDEEDTVKASYQSGAPSPAAGSGVSTKQLFENIALKALPMGSAKPTQKSEHKETATEKEEIEEDVDKASDTAVRDAVKKTLKKTLNRFVKTPISSFGNVAKDAASDSFKHAYTQRRLRLSGLTAAQAKAAAGTMSFTPGDLPVPPPLESGGNKIPWAQRLEWAQSNCVKVRAAAEAKCSGAHNKAKLSCDKSDSVEETKECADLLEASRDTCHAEHHQAYKTCNALWHAAHSQKENGDGTYESLQVEPLLYTRLDKQLHAAQVKCTKLFHHQQEKCKNAHDGAHQKCTDLQNGVAHAMNPETAFHQAQVGCETGNKLATNLCSTTQLEAQDACSSAWSSAKQVASPQLAVAMADQGGQNMANATSTCLDARKRVVSECHTAQLDAFKVCGAKPSTAPACQSLIKKGQAECSSTHRRAHKICLQAYSAAKARNEVLVKAVSASAMHTAVLVASQAKALGVPRSLAVRASRKAAQDAMLATARGEPPTHSDIAAAHSSTLHAARENIRAKMIKVVDSVRKVWKKKVSDAIKNAASSAAVHARKDGKSAPAAREAAVIAANKAAMELQHMAYEAELKAAAEATGPEVAKLVASTAEKDKRKFAALAKPYLARADLIMEKMQAAEDKVEAAREKKKKKEEIEAASEAAQAARAKAKEMRVKNAGARVAATTKAVAGAGDKVSQQLAEIARQAKAAADEAQNTVVDVESVVAERTEEETTSE